MLPCLFGEFSKAFISGICFFQYKITGKVFLTNFLKHSLLCYVLLFSSGKLFCVSDPLHFNSTRSHVIVALLLWYDTSSCFLCKKKKKKNVQISSAVAKGGEQSTLPAHQSFIVSSAPLDGAQHKHQVGSTGAPCKLSASGWSSCAICWAVSHFVWWLIKN